MKAIRIHKHGGPEVLQIDDIDVPMISENDVLVNIKSAALNHLDLWVRKGIPGTPFPLIMGSDGAGTIEQLGSDVIAEGKFKIGDEVFIVPFRTEETDITSEELSLSYKILGEHLDGVQAEFISVPADFIMHKPVNLSLEQAAAFPLAYMTAYHMLVKKVRISNGQVVLIWGASSGIGSAAIQIARHLGATVITTAGSEAKGDFAYQLGADHVINYNNKNVSEEIRQFTKNRGVDVVFDHVGELSWPHSLRSLKKGGKLVTCGSTTGPKVNIDLRHLYIKHQQIIGSTMGNRQDLAELTSLIEQEKIKPVIGSFLSYKEARQAHTLMEENQQMGKIVLNFI